MTKKEILDEYMDYDRSTSTIYTAMEEYAEQQAIAFLNYAADNGWYRNGKLGEWYQIPKQNENKTTTELYQIFKQQTT
jgi:hypothetical protein